MTLADDLRAAKALIDTPEKFEAMGMSYSAAIYEAVPDFRGFARATAALDRIRVRDTGHSYLMDRFDRAIAAAEQIEAASC